MNKLWDLIMQRKQDMIIGICDDENVMREAEEKICRSIIQNYGDDIVQIETFSDGKEVLEGEYDILILDIEMEDVDGIAVKNYFQNRKKDTIIIFVTSHDEMMSQAFGVNVMGFVTKKYLDSQLPVMLDNAIKRVINTVNIDGIDSRNICYIQAEHVYNILHLSLVYYIILTKFCEFHPSFPLRFYSHIYNIFQFDCYLKSLFHHQLELLI